MELFENLNPKKICWKSVSKCSNWFISELCVSQIIWFRLWLWSAYCESFDSDQKFYYIIFCCKIAKAFLQHWPEKNIITNFWMHALCHQSCKPVIWDTETSPIHPRTQRTAETPARYFLRCTGPSFSISNRFGVMHYFRAEVIHHLLLSLFCSVSFIIKRLSLTPTNMTLTKCPTLPQAAVPKTTAIRPGTVIHLGPAWCKGACLSEEAEPINRCNRNWSCFIIITSPWAAGRVLWCCTACGNSHQHWAYSKETTPKDKRSKETHRKSIKHTAEIKAF